MNIQDRVKEIEGRAAEANVSIDDLCESGGIHRTTWQRWKSGLRSPNLKTWETFCEAVESQLPSGKSKRRIR